MVDDALYSASASRQNLDEGLFASVTAGGDDQSKCPHDEKVSVSRPLERLKSELLPQKSLLTDLTASPPRFLAMSFSDRPRYTMRRLMG